LIDLDEPIYKYVTNADLKDDPRYRLLTAAHFCSRTARAC